MPMIAILMATFYYSYFSCDSHYTCVSCFSNGAAAEVILSANPQGLTSKELCYASSELQINSQDKENHLFVRAKMWKGDGSAIEENRLYKDNGCEDVVVFQDKDRFLIKKSLDLRKLFLIKQPGWYIVEFEIFLQANDVDLLHSGAGNIYLLGGKELSIKSFPTAVEINKL